MTRKFRIAVGMLNEHELTKEHFGDSKFYWIIDVYETGEMKFIEKRTNTTLEVEEDHEEHHGDPRKFRAVVELLRDVDVMVFYAAGPNYLRIKNQSHLVPFHVNTRNLDEVLELVKNNFDKIYTEVIAKRNTTK